MIGLTKETIERIRDDWISKYGEGSPTCVHNFLIEQCKELNPWQLINSAPKDRDILLYTEKYGRIIGKWFDGTNSWTANCMAIYPTHWQELPEDPK